MEIQHYVFGNCSFVTTHAVKDRQTDRHCSGLMLTLIRFQRIAIGLKTMYGIAVLI